MLNEIRLAARSLARNKGLSIAAIVCLTLGIAGTTTVYSVTSAIVLHPVPTPDANGLVMVTEVPPSQPRATDSYMAPANYVDLAARNKSFSELAAFRGIDANLTDIDEPERVSGFRVTPSYFRVLRVQPALGREFNVEDANYTAAPDVVIISDGLWRRDFAADPGVIGRRIAINSVPRTIVGVMPPGFDFPTGAELWTPLSVAGAFGAERDGRTLTGVLARLAPGVSLARARADVNGVMAQLRHDYPGDDAKWGMRVESADAFYGQQTRPFMLAEMAAVALVLLIACANVANLLLARATTRTRELAVRVALGASRTRIVRQQLTESLLLSLTGGALGTLLAVWGVAAVRTILPAEQALFNPGWARMGVSADVLAFAAAVSIATALIVGAVPALIASDADPHQALSEGGRGGTAAGRRLRLRGLLVAAEMALALTMVAGTLATVRSFDALETQQPGYRADHALTMQLTAPYATYPKESDAEAMYDRVLEGLRAEPGVKDAALTTMLPPEWQDHGDRIFLEGEPRPQAADPARTPRSRIVTPSYFAAMGIPLVSGRSFTIHDDSTSPAAILVNEAMARAYWPGTSAIGKRIGTAGSDTTMLTVVGVVCDVSDNPNLGRPETMATYYEPMAQAHPWRTMSLVVRTAADPVTMTHAVERTIGSVAPSVAPGSVLTLEHLHRTSLSPQRVTSEMMAAFAVIALLLAALGIHGVMSYTVAQRTHDIGVRSALGARPADIVRDVLGGALVLIGAGMAIGLAGAWVMTRTLAHLLAQGSAGAQSGVTAVVGSIVVLGLAALAGSYLPARRAMRIDPVSALRVDG